MYASKISMPKSDNQAWFLNHASWEYILREGSRDVVRNGIPAILLGDLDWISQLSPRCCGHLVSELANGSLIYLLNEWINGWKTERDPCISNAHMDGIQMIPFPKQKQLITQRSIGRCLLTLVIACWDQCCRAGRSDRAKFLWVKHTSYGMTKRDWWLVVEQGDVSPNFQLSLFLEKVPLNIFGSLMSAVWTGKKIIQRCHIWITVTVRKQSLLMHGGAL